MLALFLKRVRKRKKRISLTVCRYYICHLGLAAGYSSRLVKRDYLHSARHLNRGGSLKEYPASRALTACYHYRNGGGKSKRAGTAYHEYRNCSCESKSHARAEYRPYGKHRRRDSYHGRDEYPRYPVSRLGYRRFCRRRVTHHFYYLRQSGILSNSCCLTLDKSRSVYRRRADRVPHALIRGYALTRERRLVKRTVPFKYYAVHRYALSGAHDEYIPSAHLVDTDTHLRPVTQNGRRPRR